MYIYPCARSPHSACFILSSFIFFSFEYIYLRLDLALYVKRYTSFLSYVVFLIDKLYLKMKPPPLLQRTNMMTFYVVVGFRVWPPLSSLDKSPVLFSLLHRWGERFLQREGPHRDLEEANPSQKDPELCVLKRGRMGRQAHIFSSPSLSTGNHAKLSIIWWIYPTTLLGKYFYSRFVPPITEVHAGLGKSQMSCRGQLRCSGFCTSQAPFWSPSYFHPCLKDESRPRQTSF